MLTIRNSGSISVKTDKNGNHLGAKNGKAYAKNVRIVSNILTKKANLLNQERFFIFITIR